MANQVQDHYEVLGVPRDADPTKIKKAYRKLALIYHPDRNPDDLDAEARFIAARDAYSILIDPDKKRAYDNPFRPNGFSPMANTSHDFYGGVDLGEEVRKTPNEREAFLDGIRKVYLSDTDLSFLASRFLSNSDKYGGVDSVRDEISTAIWGKVEERDGLIDIVGADRLIPYFRSCASPSKITIYKLDRIAEIICDDKSPLERMDFKVAKRGMLARTLLHRQLMETFPRRFSPKSKGFADVSRCLGESVKLNQRITYNNLRRKAGICLEFFRGEIPDVERQNIDEIYRHNLGQLPTLRNLAALTFALTHSSQEASSTFDPRSNNETAALRLANRFKTYLDSQRRF